MKNPAPEGRGIRIPGAHTAHCVSPDRRAPQGAGNMPALIESLDRTQLGNQAKKGMRNRSSPVRHSGAVYLDRNSLMIDWSFSNFAGGMFVSLIWAAPLTESSTSVPFCPPFPSNLIGSFGD